MATIEDAIMQLHDNDKRIAKTVDTLVEELKVVIKNIEDRFVHLEQQLEYEKRLREQNPALQDAWEQYQTIKCLTEGVKNE